MGKIGVGVITCNRYNYLKACIDSIPLDDVDDLVVINDGDRLPDEAYNRNIDINIIDNPTNVGVGKSKNNALRHLLDKKCDYIFLIEDDMVILDSSIFKLYIQAHEASGIHHFNYGPGSPFNRKQTIKNFDLHNRHLLDQHSDPNPRMIIDYGNNIKVSLFPHTVAMFSFFTRESLDRAGLIDEEYYNAWEHVDHTYRIIKHGLHPPFWYFADLYNSHQFITEAPDAINNSSIANNGEQWMKNISTGREIYKRKHGHYPNQPPFTSKKDVVSSLKEMKNS